VHLTDTGQRYIPHLDAELHLLPGDVPSASGQIYGRHRLADPIEVSGAVSLEDLTALFPGY
jgi:hypothetical protein